jgi:hypothetical protein
MRRVTRILLAILTITGLAGILQANATPINYTMSDNLSATVGGDAQVTTTQWVAAPFGAYYPSFPLPAYPLSITLNSVTLLMHQVTSGEVEADIYEGRPGSWRFVEALISPGSYPTSDGYVTFTSSLIFLKESYYWVVLKALSGEYSWAWTESDKGSGGFLHMWSYSPDSGHSWNTYDYSPQMMRVYATYLTPVPPSLLLLGSGLVSLAGFRRWRRG